MIAVKSESEDWLSKTIRTVKAEMDQHGFVEDVATPIKLASMASTTTWENLLRRFNLLRLS
jgi:hypothetical protein